MIGLEYICHLYKIQYKDVANDLGISKQTVNSWIKGRRKIPEKYIPILSEKFKIPKRFFQKEFTELDKLKIQNIKLHRQNCDDGKKHTEKEDRKLAELESKVEIELENMELQEAIEDVNKNLRNMVNKKYPEFDYITYGLKALFDIYNSKKTDLIGFNHILYSIAKYLNIEGYRDEDADDGLEYVDSPLEFQRKEEDEVSKLDKEFFKLLKYREHVEKEYDKAEKEFWKG